MVFASDYVNTISYLLMVKIYMDSNTQKKLKDVSGGERKTFDKKQMHTMVSSKVCFLVSAYASVMQSLHRKIPVFYHAGKSFRCRSCYRLSDLRE